MIIRPPIRNLLVVFWLLLSATLFAQPDWQWATSISCKGDNMGKMAVDASGNVYICGDFRDTVDFDPGPGVHKLISVGTGTYLLKLDRFGKFIWVKKLTSSGTPRLTGITTDPIGDIYITGSFIGAFTLHSGIGPGSFISVGSYGDIFFIKLNASGNLVKALTLGDTLCDFWNVQPGVSADLSGNLYIKGYFRGILDFNPGTGIKKLTSNSDSQDFFILKLNNSLEFVWVSSFGGPGDELLFSIAIDKEENVFSMGNFDYQIDLDPGIDSVIVSPKGYADIFISKLNSSGNLLWAGTIGSQNPENLGGIAINSKNQLLISCSFGDTLDVDPDTSSVFNIIPSGGSELALLCLDSSGDFVWAKAVGGPNGDEYGGSLAIDTSDNIYMAAIFTGTTDLNPDTSTSFTLTSAGYVDAFLGKYTEDGDFIFGIQIGGYEAEYVMNMFADTKETVFISGLYRSDSIMIGDTKMFNSNRNTSTLAYDLFVARLGEDFTGLSEIGLLPELLIYPNPAGDYFFVDPLPSSGKCQIHIQNLEGRTVYHSEINSGVRQMLSTESLDNGFYIIQVQSGDVVVSRKIIISK